MPQLRTAWVTFDCYGTPFDWASGIRQFLRTDLGRDDLLEEWEDIQFRMIQGPYRPYREILADSLRETLQVHGLEFRPEPSGAFIRSSQQPPAVGQGTSQRGLRRFLPPGHVGYLS